MADEPKELSKRQVESVASFCLVRRRFASCASEYVQAFWADCLRRVGLRSTALSTNSSELCVGGLHELSRVALCYAGRSRPAPGPFHGALSHRRQVGPRCPFQALHS